jgi:NAD(P)-dependent dehydrogenase (short-subunit alcohol dehydrogenase family)
MDLNNKVALVTGASQGIGLAFCRSLIDRGVVVYGLARNPDRLNDVSSELGDSFHGISCDVADVDEVAKIVNAVAGDAGRIDILVNNAGIGFFGSVDTISPDDWQRMMDTNINGVFSCTRAVVPIMKSQNEESGFGGHIVNISSVAGLIGNPNLSGYNLTKFGLRGFTDALMKEVRHDGIKVSGVYPGSVATEFVDGGTADGGWKIQPYEIAETLIHILEMPDNNLISDVVIRPLRPPRR